MDPRTIGDEARRPAASCRVLVVDDSPIVRRLVAGWLREGGCSVAEAADGLEAMECFRRDPVQVVISDLGMPRVGGLELLAALRKQQVPPEVILLTGSHASDFQAAVQALRLGAHDYIVKDATAAEAVRLAVQGAAEKWQLREENARLLRELRYLSITDPLTGVGNRRALDEALRQEMARARRHGTDLALILLDLDRFKRVNDALGHRAGDEILVSFAARLGRIARDCDRLFRYGGEEFAVVLGDTSLEGGAALAQRIVDATASAPMATGQRALIVTCSAGVAALEIWDASPEAFMKRADGALYGAKRQGRNRIFVARPACRVVRPASARADRGECAAEAASPIQRLEDEHAEHERAAV